VIASPTRPTRASQRTIARPARQPLAQQRLGALVIDGGGGRLDGHLAARVGGARGAGQPLGRLAIAELLQRAPVVERDAAVVVARPGQVERLAEGARGRRPLPRPRVDAAQRHVDARDEPRLEAERQRPPESVARGLRAPEPRERVAELVPRLGPAALEIDGAPERGHRVLEPPAPRRQPAARDVPGRVAREALRHGAQRGPGAVEVARIGHRLGAHHLGRRAGIRVAGQLIERTRDPIEDPHGPQA
jgi:hypothetical protein